MSFCRTLAFDMGSPVASRLPDYKSDFRTDYKMDFKDGKDTLSNGVSGYVCFL